MAAIVSAKATDPGRSYYSLESRRSPNRDHRAPPARGNAERL